VLSAGVGNDVVGWILLALCVALVNSGAGLTALYIFLVSIAYVLFVAFAVRPAFMWMLRKTGSLANGPTQGVVAVTVLLVLTSAFITGVIGIHPIFGAFIIGLMAPHEGGFAIKLTEKLEDLVSVLFLPLYFALSGLSTNLGLLDNGITWAYVIGVCAIAFLGKVAGGTIASRLNGLVWRESFTIGCLMSCKGLVELIVLNIGLQARILSKRTFTIFVVMALITTFATTPLTSWLYPPWYQRKLELWKQGKIDWDGNPLHPDEHSETGDADFVQNRDVARKILVYLRLDGLPSLFTIVSLLGNQHTGDRSAQPAHALKDRDAMSLVTLPRSRIQVHGLRLMELTERESSVMRVSELEEYATRDPIIKALGTFGQSQNISVAGRIAVVPQYSFPGTLVSKASELRSDLLLIPWSGTGTMSEYPSLWDARPGDVLGNKQFLSLVGETFEKARERCHVGVFVDKATLDRDTAPPSPVMERSTKQLSRTMTGVSLHEAAESTVHFRSAETGKQKLIVLYQGGEDDIFAVRLALQLAKNENVNVNIITSGSAADREGDVEHESDLHLTNLRASIPADVADRVTFTGSDSRRNIDGLLGAIRDADGAEVVAVLGRGGVDMAASVSGLHSEARAIGPRAVEMLNVIKEGGVCASLLVVQAKKGIADGAQLQRKASHASEEL